MDKISWDLSSKSNTTILYQTKKKISVFHLRTVKKISLKLKIQKFRV